jgi:hypothetical protein
MKSMRMSGNGAISYCTQTRKNKSASEMFHEVQEGIQKEADATRHLGGLFFLANQLVVSPHAVYKKGDFPDFFILFLFNTQNK